MTPAVEKGAACAEYVEHAAWQGVPFCARCLRPPWEHPENRGGIMYDQENADTRCPRCKGSGRGHGPDTKQESPVAPGLMIWTPPVCPTCDGSGVYVPSDPICEMHDWPLSYHSTAERAECAGGAS